MADQEVRSTSTMALGAQGSDGAAHSRRTLAGSAAELGGNMIQFFVNVAGTTTTLCGLPQGM
jgi:hypothetical protein